MSGAQKSLSDYDLVSYLDDEADPDRREELDGLVPKDPATSARVELWRRNDELLRIAFGRVAAEPLPASLHLNPRAGGRPEASLSSDDAPIRAPIRQVRRIDRIRREQRERLVALTVASFAAGVVATLGVAGFTELAPRVLARPAAYIFPSLSAEAAGERTSRRAMEAFWTFANDEAHPGEASDKADIAGWLSRRVGAPVRAPDLSSFGLRLLGGRLTPGDHGAAALILYQTNAGNRIGLYVGRSASEERTFHYAEDHVTGAVWWMERGESYVVVGRADRIGLTKIARRVRAQEPTHAQYPFTAQAPG